MSAILMNGKMSSPQYASGNVVSLSNSVRTVCGITFDTPFYEIIPTDPLAPPPGLTQASGFVTVWGAASFEGVSLGTNSYVCELGVGIDSSSAFTRSHATTVANPSFSDDTIEGLTVLYRGALGPGTHTINLLAATTSPVTSGTISVDGDLLVVFSGQ